LRNLHLDDYPATRRDKKHALVVEQDLRLKFQNQVLEDLTLANILQQFSAARKKHRH
jgi:hypothetical protein